MAGYLSGYDKVDTLFIGNGVTNTEQISQYVDMKNYAKAIFIVAGGSMGSTSASTSCYIAVRGIEAVTATGSGAISLPSSGSVIIGATGTTYLANAAIATVITGSSGVTGDTIVINGITFTWSTTVSSTQTVGATRLISASSDPEKTAIQLTSGINGTYGCTGIVASNAAEVITLYPKDMDRALTISITQTAPTSSGTAQVYPRTVVGYYEVLSEQIHGASSYSHVAVGVTPSTSCDLSVTCIRSAARYSPTQYVADYEEGAST